MSKFKQAMYWLRKGKKVCRPCWEKKSYWMLAGTNVERIVWADGENAAIHLKQLEADDWELYKEPQKEKPKQKEIITVRDLIKKLEDYPGDWEVEARDENDKKLPRTKIVAVNNSESLYCLFG